MSGTGRRDVVLEIHRTAQVSDGEGNSYAILDVGPEPDDPAVLLSVRLGATQETFGVPLRPGRHFDRGGLDLTVSELDVSEPARARVRLTGSVPRSGEGPTEERG